jgi:hypothetical protein
VGCVALWQASSCCVNVHPQVQYILSAFTKFTSQLQHRHSFSNLFDFPIHSSHQQRCCSSPDVQNYVPESRHQFHSSSTHRTFKTNLHSCARHQVGYRYYRAPRQDRRMRFAIGTGVKQSLNYFPPQVPLGYINTHGKQYGEPPSRR